MVSMFSSGTVNALRQQQGDFPDSKASVQCDADAMIMVDHDPYEEVVVINVAGKKFETYERTLSKFPNSLLGDPDRRQAYTNPKTGECFFDRHRGAFEAILYYYQSGGLIIRPQNIPVHVFIQECQFFDIGAETIERLHVESGLKEADVKIELPKWLPQRLVWNFLEFPDSSRGAKLFAITSVIIITLSLIMFVMESLPEFSPTTVEKDGKTIYIPSKHTAWMFSVNTAVIIWFTVEFLLRLLACPNKVKFFTAPLNLIDLLSILPYYISLLIPQDDANSLSVLRVIRVIRVLRVFKLSRHSRGLQILGNTLKASVHELFMLAFFLFVVILIFGSCVYYAEYEVKGTKFRSIPSSFWWAIVTMTTVGYGDMYPQTFWGQIVGGMAVVCGVLTIALPVPVVVSNFEYFYSRERNRRKMEEAKKEQDREKENHRGVDKIAKRKLTAKWNTSKKRRGSVTEEKLEEQNDPEKGHSEHSKLNGEAVCVDIPEWNQYTTSL